MEVRRWRKAGAEGAKPNKKTGGLSQGHRLLEVMQEVYLEIWGNFKLKSKRGLMLMQLFQPENDAMSYEQLRVDATQ